MTDRIEAMQAAMSAKTGEPVPIATAEAVLAEFERLVGPGEVRAPVTYAEWVSAYVRLGVTPPIPPALRALRRQTIPAPDDQTGAEVRARAEFG